MSFVIAFTDKEGKDTFRTVTWKNFHAIAREMANTKRYAPKQIVAAKLENELKRREGR